MIYTEPFVVTGGGPGNSTTFLSIDLVKIALGQFDLGQAAAMSLIYFLIILLLCWIFYTVMTNAGAERRAKEGIAHDAFDSRPPHHHVGIPVFLLLPIYWLRQHVVQDQQRDPRPR